MAVDRPVEMAKRPGFSRINELQESALRGKLLTARELISHPAEKGRSLEGEVAAVVRDMLPAEYGVGTGFVAYHGASGPELSAQLDIIIFDAVRGGPIGRLAACEVYPIESVYGYVEVKASLSLPGPNAEIRGNSLQACMEQNHRLREMKERRFWELGHVWSPPTVTLMSAQNWLSLRGFVFAFEPNGTAASNPETLAQGMSNSAKEYDAHLHGVLILDHVYLTTIPVDVDTADPEDFYHVSYTTDHVLTAFKLHLLKALATFQRPPENWVPAKDVYFELPKNWQEVSPDSQ